MLTKSYFFSIIYMEKEEVSKYIKKIFNAYRSIPKSAFRNPITYESILDNKEWVKRGYTDKLPIPAGMLPKREVGEIYIGIYPVFYYEKETVGVALSYFSTKGNVTRSFGPYDDADEFIREFTKFEGNKNYDFICKYIKADASFMLTYQEAALGFEFKKKSLPEVPCMKIFNVVGSVLGVSLDIAEEYIVNPYCYDDLMVRHILYSEYSQSVRVSIHMGSIDDYQPLDYKVVKRVLKIIKSAIKSKRKTEDELINRFYKK